MLAKILDPSKCGADYRSITYERSGTVVMHECAPIAQRSGVHLEYGGSPAAGLAAGLAATWAAGLAALLVEGLAQLWEQAWQQV